MFRGQRNLLNVKLKMENGKLNTLKIFNFQLSIFNSRVAFTLAEVLITLAIIGVVAAMTMPVLIQKQTEKTTIVALKKDYSLLSNALLMAVSEYGDIANWGSASYTYKNSAGDDADITTVNIDNITKYLKIVKDCGNEAKGCFAQRYTEYNSDSNERDFENLSYYRKFMLANGASVAMQGYGLDNDTNYGEIWIDVNGSQKPNIVGRDLFLFQIRLNNTLVPYRVGNSPNDPYNTGGWVIEFENMDYLRCPDELAWNGKHRCD